MVQLYGRAKNALDTDSIGAHDYGHFFTGFVQYAKSHRIGVLIAELEDIPDLDCLHDLDGAARVNAGLARRYLPKVEELRLKILAWCHIAQVVVVLVCAGDHVAASL